MTGRIILLNGTSSSGKSTLARALQTALPAPFIHLSADNVLGGYPFSHPATDTASLRPLGRLFYETVALFADNDVDVVAEQVFQQPAQLEDAVRVLQTHRLWFVGVHCTLDVAEARERERNDGTTIGTARYQHDRVHRHGTYDVEVDTTTNPTGTSVGVIIGALDREPMAFRTLAAR